MFAFYLRAGGGGEVCSLLFSEFEEARTQQKPAAEDVAYIMPVKLKSLENKQSFFVWVVQRGSSSSSLRLAMPLLPQEAGRFTRVTLLCKTGE